MASRPLLWVLALTFVYLLLAASPASAQDSPHQESSLNTSTCASCHSTHAQATDGSDETSNGAICLRCHTQIAVTSQDVDPLTRHDLGSQGTMSCIQCHAPHRTTSATRITSPLDNSVLLSSAIKDLVSADGSVYALVGSQNDAKAPTLSTLALYPAEDGTALVTWATDEDASSWVDWEPSAQYQPGQTDWEMSLGSPALTKTHRLTITGLVPGTSYHYRVRSIDALGNVGASAAGTFISPYPYEPESAALTTQTVDSVVTTDAPAAPAQESPPPASGARLVYADEFDGPLDTSVWQQLTPWRTQYTTGELQHYTPENVTFANGYMRILAERRSSEGYEYASGIVTSLDKPFSYGYFESRFNMPTGKGLWPAFWLTNDRTHEIDMMELLGEDPNRMYFTYHKGGEQLFQRYFDNGTDLTSGWHTVGMDWQPTYIRWYLDGQLVAEYTGEIISDPMYLIFNTAVGGAWAVDPDAATPFPQTFEIDYVRVYDKLPSESLASAAALADPLTWRESHIDYGQYSVDTDQITLALDSRDGGRTRLTPAAGWESAGPETAKPLPSSPGAPVTAATLDRAAAADGMYWRTAVADVDREWNWQVIRFELGDTSADSLQDLALQWDGHGEPTEGYPTVLYVWDGESWRLAATREAPADTVMSLDQSSVDESFCLTCHDGPAPEGVVMPAGVTDVGAKWETDLHGGGAGTGFGGSLSAPYGRGGEAVECATCHDPHGSASVYHIPASVNATATPTITSGAELRSLCVSCHEGSLNDWHAQCVDCHNNGHWAGWVDPPVSSKLPTPNTDCTQCHGHGKSWTHPATCLRCHGTTELNALGATPDAAWTYERTF